MTLRRAAAQRELDIVAGQISSERTPVRSPAPGSAPIDLTKLNLDSDGAFRTAEKEASRNQVGFDSLNYRLAVDGASGQPVWIVEMFDYEQRPVGTVRIAASNGTLLSAGNWVSEGREAPSTGAATIGFGGLIRTTASSERRCQSSGGLPPARSTRIRRMLLRKRILTHTPEKPLLSA